MTVRDHVQHSMYILPILMISSVQSTLSVAIPSERQDPLLGNIKRSELIQEFNKLELKGRASEEGYHGPANPEGWCCGTAFFAVLNALSQGSFNPDDLNNSIQTAGYTLDKELLTKDFRIIIKGPLGKYVTQAHESRGMGTGYEHNVAVHLLLTKFFALIGYVDTEHIKQDLLNDLQILKKSIEPFQRTCQQSEDATRNFTKKIPFAPDPTQGINGLIAMLAPLDGMDNFTPSWGTYHRIQEAHGALAQITALSIDNNNLIEHPPKPQSFSLPHRYAPPATPWVYDPLMGVIWKQPLEKALNHYTSLSDCEAQQLLNCQCCQRDLELLSRNVQATTPTSAPELLLIKLPYDYLSKEITRSRGDILIYHNLKEHADLLRAMGWTTQGLYGSSQLHAISTKIIPTYLLRIENANKLVQDILQGITSLSDTLKAGTFLTPGDIQNSATNLVHLVDWISKQLQRESPQGYPAWWSNQLPDVDSLSKAVVSPQHSLLAAVHEICHVLLLNQKG